MVRYFSWSFVQKEVAVTEKHKETFDGLMNGIFLCAAPATKVFLLQFYF